MINRLYIFVFLLLSLLWSNGRAAAPPADAINSWYVQTPQPRQTHSRDKSGDFGLIPERQAEERTLRDHQIGQRYPGDGSSEFLYLETPPAFPAAVLHCTAGRYISHSLTAAKLFPFHSFP